MIRKMVCALFVMTVAGIVVADEASGVITDVKGNAFTFQKMKKKEKDGDPIKMTLATDGVVAKGNFNKDTKKVEKGENLDGGLSNKVFAGDKGVAARVTFEGTKASQILVIGGKKKDNK